MVLNWIACLIRGGHDWVRKSAQLAGDTRYYHHWAECSRCGCREL